MTNITEHKAMAGTGLEDWARIELEARVGTGLEAWAGTGLEARAGTRLEPVTGLDATAGLLIGASFFHPAQVQIQDFRQILCMNKMNPSTANSFKVLIFAQDNLY